MQPHHWTIAGLVYALFELGGMLSAVHVLMWGRTPQGAIAWMFFLVSFPVLALPLYWVFGPRKYANYIDARMRAESPFDPVVDKLREAGEPFIVDREESASTLVALERLVRLPFLQCNDVELLIDGRETFDAIFEAIDNAQDYVLLQFFIVKDDDIGTEVGNRLRSATERGVRVFFLFDEIGSRKLSRRFIEWLSNSGVIVHAFSTTRSAHRLQLNFRNHRKIVVADGRVALTGGINIGDEYLGGDPKLTPWRDTFIRVTGPAVQTIQLSFLEDWYWATDAIPDWEWNPAPAPSGKSRDVLVMPTGPADPMDSCSLIFVSLIHAARDRIWIATPYFVFDAQITSALQIAALSGVDVRIIVPAVGDHAGTFLAGWSFYDEVLESGCRIVKYEAGFPHQKVLLIDDHLAMVGSANLDNRSMRLNFELGVLVDDTDFASEVEAMLLRDMETATDVARGEFARKSFFFRLRSRFARLFAPIL